MQIRSRHKPIRLVFICGVILILASCNPDRRAERLFRQAQQVFNSAQAMENTSYEEALVLYEKALKKIDQIPRDHPTSQLAVEITQDRVQIQNIPLTTLRNNLLPQVKTKAQAEGNLGICALYLAGKITSPDTRRSTFTKISRRYLEVGLDQEAIQIIKEIKDSPFRRSVEKDIAEWYLGKERYEDARKYLSLIQSQDLNRELGSRIFEGFFQTGHYQEAEAMLALTSSPEEKIIQLLRLAQAYAQNGQQKKADDLSDRAFQGIKTLSLLDRPFTRENELSELADFYIKNEQTDQVLETISKIENPDHQLNKYFEFIENLSATGREGKAKEIAGLACQKTQPLLENINWGMFARVCRRAENQEAPLKIISSLALKTKALPPSYEKDQELVQLVKKYAEAAEFNQAQTLCDSISVPYFRALGLCEIAEQLISAGKKEEARRLLNRAYPMIQGTFKSPIRLWVTSDTRREEQISPEEYREWMKLNQYLHEMNRDLEKEVMSRLIVLIARAGDFDQAFAVIEKEIGSYGRLEIYLVLVNLCLEAGNKEKAVQALSSALRAISSASGFSIRDSLDHPEVNKRLGVIFLAERYLSGEEITKLAPLAEIAEDPLIKIVIWSRLAENIENDDKNKAVEYIVKALQIVYQITDPAIQLQALNDLAGLYASIGQYDQNLRGIEIIRDDYLKVKALVSIAEELDKLGKRDRARDLFSRAGTMANGIVNPRQKASALAMVALGWARHGDREQALSWLSLARAAEHNLPNAEDKINFLFTLSQVCIELKDREKNREILALVYQYVDSLQQYAKAGHLEEIADKYLEAGDYDEAISFFQKITIESLRLKIGEKIVLTLMLNGQFDRAFQLKKTFFSRFWNADPNPELIKKIAGTDQPLKEREDVSDVYPQAFNLLADSPPGNRWAPLLLVELNISVLKNKLVVGRKVKNLLHKLIQNQTEVN